MSHDGGHSEHADGLGGPLLPASADLSWGVRILVILVIATSIMQGSFVVGSSRDMHVWPAADSAKVDLPPFHP